jgi:hypothetical protein
MNYIPNYLYDKSILRSIDDLIHEGYRSFEETLDVDKDQLVSKCINLLGNDVFDFMAQPDVLMSLKRCIMSTKSEDRSELFNRIRLHVEENVFPDLSALYDDRHELMKQFGDAA